jgi:thioredoxin reductase (NADPH)
MSTELELAFPRLTPRQIAELRPHGTTRQVVVGDVLFNAGDRDFSFFIVLSGAVEILAHSGSETRVVTVHEPGAFTGDVDLLSGRGALVTGRVSVAGEVVELPAAVLRRVVSESPDVGEVLLRAFITRRALFLAQGYTGIKIIGSRFSQSAHQLREFATRNAIPFVWLDLEVDVEAETLLHTMGVPASATPVVIGRDGRWVSNPSVSDLAHYMGLEHKADAEEVYDLIVVGAGPAGLAAAVYAASEGLRTLVLDALAAGGQAGTSSFIENYVGFPMGISGAELAQRALLQAQKFGAEVSVPTLVTGLRLDGGLRVVKLDDGSEVHARALVVTSGIEYKRLDVPRIRELEGRGVYHAATEMEARMCGGDEVVVVGGGNSAGQAAVFLSRTTRRVHIVIRGDDLAKSMSRYLIDRIERIENITVHRHRVVSGVDGDHALTHVTLQSVSGEPDLTLDARALFIFIGAVPHTGWLGDCVALDENGFVLTGPALSAAALSSDAWQTVNRDPYFLETSLPGIFVAGDARSGSVKRVASAVGEGAMAISFVHAHLGTLA